MLNAIRSFEPRVAAGLLAQAALHLDCPMVEIEKPLVDNQREIEASILSELRIILGISQDDCSEGAIEALSDALDKQTEAVGQFSKEGSIERLSAEGLLPSDVYEIAFDPQLSTNFQWRWEVESKLAIQTIKQPHREQILGNSTDDTPRVTLFGRYFAHRYPARSFWLLTAGSREGKTLQVSLAWRVYPSEIDLTECETLLDVLKAFADRYGHLVTLGGETAKFFFRLDVADAPPDRSFTFELRGGRPETITVTAFQPPTKSGRYVFLLIPINLTRYFNYVSYWRGWDKNILQDTSIPKSALSANILPTPG